MKNNFMIEKLQTILPPQSDGSNKWASLPQKHTACAEYDPAQADFGGKSIHKDSYIGFAGCTDVTDNSTAAALNSKVGYTRADMSPTDDQYTGEMCDPFYDEMNVDGEVGFAERHNYLDRI